MFVLGRPDKKEVIGERIPEVNKIEGETHIQCALLNIASDKCDNAVGVWATHTDTHTYLYMYTYEHYTKKYEIT